MQLSIDIKAQANFVQLYIEHKLIFLFIFSVEYLKFTIHVEVSVEPN